MNVIWIGIYCIESGVIIVRDSRYILFNPIAVFFGDERKSILCHHNIVDVNVEVLNFHVFLGLSLNVYFLLNNRYSLWNNCLR